MADFEDAAYGWSIYRDRAGAVSLDQLNQLLTATSLQPIAKRTYTHYKKLLRLGYQEYVSINRLDIRHANDSVFDVSDRSRYLDWETTSPARLLIPTSSGWDTFDGVLLRVSEGFATLRVPRTEAAIRAAWAIKYNKGIIIFEEVGVERAVEVVEAESADDAIDLLLQFRSLLETDLLISPSSLPTGLSQFAVNLGPDPSFFQVIQVLRRTFDLFESSRGFTELALSAASVHDGPLPPPRIRHLEVSNPVELIIGGAILTAGSVAYVVKKVAGAVEGAAAAVTAVQRVSHDANAEERDQERHRLEMDSLQLDNLKRGVEVIDMLADLAERTDAIVNDNRDLDDPTVAKLEALKNQAIEAGTELVMASREPLALSIGDEEDGP